MFGIWIAGKRIVLPGVIAMHVILSGEILVIAGRDGNYFC
jgi:hypothetical protein